MYKTHQHRDKFFTKLKFISNVDAEIAEPGVVKMGETISTVSESMRRVQ